MSKNKEFIKGYLYGKGTLAINKGNTRKYSYPYIRFVITEKKIRKEVLKCFDDLKIVYKTPSKGARYDWIMIVQDSIIRFFTEFEDPEFPYWIKKKKFKEVMKLIDESWKIK